MIGLIIKDFLTIKKKYGITRAAIDIVIVLILMFTIKGSAAIYISLLFVPMEVASMVMSLITCDEQWKWWKYAISLPVSKKGIVGSRYLTALIISISGLIISLLINVIAFLIMPEFKFGFYLFLSISSFFISLFYLTFILPSNYYKGVNAGFAAMIILVILLFGLGLWTELANNSIMWFVVKNFELSFSILFITIGFAMFVSYKLSVSFFKKKYY